MLLLLSTVDAQAEALRAAAARLGVTLIAGSDRSEALEDPWSAGAIAVPYDDTYGAGQSIAEYAAAHPLDAIVAIGDGAVGGRTAAAAAVASEALGSPSHQPYAAFACQDRFEFRSLLEGAGLPVPQFQRIAAITRQPSLPPGMSFPCVLKPAGRTEGRAVLRADSAEQFQAAFAKIRALLESPDVHRMMDDAANWILVEEYLEGQEALVEAVIDQGRFLLLAVFDQVGDHLGSSAGTSGGTISVTPSRLSEEAQTEIARAAALAAHAVGLYHGPVHARVRLTQAGPRVVDLQASPANGLRARAMRFENGWPLEELILRHALGEAIESVGRESAASGVMTIPVPADGVLEEIRGEAEARKVPGIEDILIPVQPGQKLAAWPEASYMGVLYAHAESPEEVQTALRDAGLRLEFRIARS